MFQELSNIMNRHPVTIRIKMRSGSLTDWSHWLGVPTPKYLELQSCSSCPSREVQWLEINPVENRHIDTVMPVGPCSHAEPLKSDLAAAGIQFEEIDGYFRVLAA